MESIWVVIATTLLSFCLCVITYVVGHRRGYRKGFIKGASKILAEWKEELYLEDKNND